MNSIPLYFIAGFLGSGKTTVLNQLLSSLDGRRAGLIINEFGTIGVDAARVEGHEDEIFELNNGQIFCACLAGPLASSLTRLAEKRPELIIAECSGLSKPATLRDMAAGVAKTTDNGVHFAGLITVVDGPRYHVLQQSVQAVREQVAYAGAVIVNKTDLMQEEEILTVESQLRSLRPGIPVLRAEFGRVEFSKLEAHLSLAEEIPELDQAYMGWGDSGRPKPSALLVSDPVSRERLERFLKAASKKAFRIKGAVPAAEGFFIVDCVEEIVEITENDGTPETRGLVLIAPGDGFDGDDWRRLWDDTA